jgi:hypothetical protein
MDIGKLSVTLVDKLLQTTVDYQPSPERLRENKKRLGYGLAATIGGAATSMYPIAFGGAVYSAIKFYQVRRDMR